MWGEAGRPHFNQITARQWGGPEHWQQHQWGLKKSRESFSKMHLTRGQPDDQGK